MKAIHNRMIICVSILLIALASCNNSARHSYKRIYKESQQSLAESNIPRRPVIVDAPRQQENTFEDDVAVGLRDFKKPEDKPVVAAKESVRESVKETQVAEADKGVVFVSGKKLKLIYGKGEVQKYNAVVVTLSVRRNLDRLISILEQDALPFMVAEDYRGLYFVIVASSNDQSSILQKRKEVIEKYTTKYSSKALMQKYGMPFTDMRIVVNE